MRAFCHYSLVFLKMFHTQGSKANYKSNKSVTYELIFLIMRRAFCHYSLVCAMLFHTLGSKANCKSKKSLTHKLKQECNAKIKFFFEVGGGRFVIRLNTQGSKTNRNQTRV